MDIDTVLVTRKGVHLVRFNNAHDKQVALRRGIYFFDKKPFIVKAWNEGLTLKISSLQSLPIWIQFPERDIKYWGTESLSELGNMLGVPIKTDRITKETSALHYARMLVEVP